MNTPETCEPFFKYMRKDVDLDPDTMDLVAAQAERKGFPGLAGEQVRPRNQIK